MERAPGGVTRAPVVDYNGPYRVRDAGRPRARACRTCAHSPGMAGIAVSRQELPLQELSVAMKKIKDKVATILEEGSFSSYSVVDVAADKGCAVDSYEKLVDLVAEIGYRNPQFTLLFRGQHEDYREPYNPDKKISSLFPSAWRKGPKGRNQAKTDMKEWCERLQELKTVFSKADRRRLRAIPERPWAILQHYSSETKCVTPLLDVTDSLRVAASVATQGYLGETKNARPYGFVFVFGFPAIDQGTTISVDDGLILLRLAAVCPKNARRPHFQHGFLAGTFPTDKLCAGKKYKNFALRLIGKLRVSTGDSFWDIDCPLRERALFPDFDSLRDELKRLECARK